MHRECDHDGAVFCSSVVDIRREDRKRLEEDPVAKRKDSVRLIDKHRNVATTATARNIPTIRHLLQHSRWSARRRVLLWNKESDTEDVKKMDRRIPKGERKALWLAKYECVKKVG